jgi:hypothetical protein
MAKKKEEESAEVAEAPVGFGEERLEALNESIAKAEADLAKGKAMIALVEPKVEHLKGVVDRIKEASTTEKQVARLEEAEKMVADLYKEPAVEEAPAEEPAAE